MAAIISTQHTAHSTQHTAHSTQHTAHSHYYCVKTRQTLRFIFTIIQIILDIVLYNLCFLVTDPLINFNVRSFLSGTMFLCFASSKLYGFYNWELWDEIISVLKASVLMVVLCALYGCANKFAVSFMLVLYGIIIYIPVVIVSRYFFRAILFSCGLLSFEVIIIGAGKSGEILAHNLASSSFSLRKVTSFLDDDDNKQGKIISGFPVLGKTGEAAKILARTQADEAVIAIPTAAGKKLYEILRALNENIKRVLYTPDMYMLATYSAEIRNIDGLTAITSAQGLKNPMNRFIKSIIDYAGAILALIIFSPVMLWAAYKIKREDGAPVLFIQERVGFKAKKFKIYKFRTMYKDADERTKILFRDPKVFESYKKGIKLKNDPRLTHTGDFLRKTSIDELPQIFNILKNEMSLVGPRPLMASDVDIAYGEKFAEKVYSAKPGLTGIWQVSGRSDLDTDFRRKINLYYVHNWSLWLDIAILLKTPAVVLSGKGAY